MDWSLIASAAVDEPTFLASAFSQIAALAWMIFAVGAGLGFVIFVHELGHFLVAKACGVKCDKFYIGFDIPVWIPFTKIQLPSKLFHFTYGETEYGVGILPLGGYVKMLGQDDDPRNAEAEAERTKVLKEGTAAEGLKSGQAVETVLDPRSFPAKSIPARMAIISAGVIMNAIFAVILAAIAYRLGVPYTPAVIGNTVVGSPAWQAGIQPGDKIVRIGKHRDESPYLRFADDLMKSVIFNGTDRDLDIEIQHANASEETLTLRPVKAGKKDRPSLGVRPSYGLDVGVPKKLYSHLNANSSAELKSEDKIVSVAGVAAEKWTDVAPILASNFDKPLEFVLERKGKEKDAVTETITATLQPRKRRWTGIAVQGNEVSHVRKGSVAAAAGLQVGDRIVTIDGGPFGDPLSLNQRLVRKIGTEITLGVSRPEGKSTKDVEIKITPAATPGFHESHYFNKEAVSVEVLGIGLATTTEIDAVVEESPAALAGLQPKDVLVSATLVNKDAARLKADLKSLDQQPGDVFTFDVEKGTLWQQLMWQVENCHSTTSLKVTYKRGMETRTAEILPTDAPDFYDEMRGLHLLSLQDIRIVHSNGEAFQLGFRETKERLEEVLTTLSHLGTGRIKLTDLSGPLGILAMAGSTANVGISSLLIFLTLLSANLAIINFMPIPALDGGHMVFLTWEWIMGKPVDPEMQVKLTLASLFCLLSLMLIATYSDVGRLYEIFF